MGMKDALLNSTTRYNYPFRHWVVLNPFSDAAKEEVKNTTISNAPRAYDGTRAADHGGGGLDANLRVFVEPDNADQFPEMKAVIDDLLDPETIVAVEKLIERDLSEAYLRLEVIADREGFWLEPHKDIKEKLMSMLVYVNPYNESENLGTDLYDTNIKLVKTVPYRDNLAYLFAPGDDTWHGLEKKEIKKERRSVLINYVTFETPWKLPQFER